MRTSEQFTQGGLPDPALRPEFYADTATKRLMAWLIDSCITLILTIIVLPFTAFVGLLFFFGLFTFVGFVYRWASMASGSATWGMRLMAVEFRTHDGDHLGGGLAFLHTLGYSLSMSFVMPQVISVGLMLTTPKGQGLTDLVLGTAPINRVAQR